MLEKKINAREEVTLLGAKPEAWTVEPSFAALHCKNFIRDIVDNLNLEPNPEKPVIALSYFPSTGQESARQAVADYLSVDGARVSSSDVILCSGCSSALEHAITIDHNTAALVINNPSNPCGSVWSESHLRAVMSVARHRRIPVIADEIYERLVFPGETFVSVAALEAGVPTLICGGLAKRFLVPGWRLGWIVVHDEVSALHDIRSALVRLTQRTIGSCTLVQAALPAILHQTPSAFHENLAETLQRHAQIAFDCLKEAKGLTPYMPQGAMYMVCFFLPNFMRIVITVPEELLQEACERITQFCNRYYQK
nr:unnamed protein product [Callosobruchus chinensis]